MEKNIPITISVPKLLEWLTSRRHCSGEWQAEVVKIREKINNAIQDMPANQTIASLLSGTYINYFHCLKIVEILKETEADSKNIFGMYSSKRMKDWQEILTVYKKNNVYLAEAADLLINTARYELPNLKKMIAKQEQLQTDYKKKEAEAIKANARAKKDLTLFLKELGLEGEEKSYRSCLISSANQLSSVHDSVAEESKKLLPAVEHYRKFVEAALPQQSVDMELLKYVAERGNTTVYEWKYGETPDKVILPPPVYSEEEQDVLSDEIDWGYDLGGMDQGEPSQANNVQIEIIDSGAEHGGEEETKQETISERVARDGEALTILDSINTRLCFLNNLLELRSFVKTRIYEIDDGVSNDFIVESSSVLKELSQPLEKVIAQLTSKTTQHFYNILYLPNYLDGIIAKIRQKEDAIERNSAIAVMSKEKIDEAITEAASLQKKAQIIVKKSKELQEEIKKDISLRYSERSVFLMGGPTL